MALVVSMLSISVAGDLSYMKKGLREIVERGKLIVGVCKIDQPPFYQRDKDGKLSGTDIDLAEGIAEDLGVKLEINNDAENWDGLVSQLQKGQIDLAISFLSKTTPRAKSILYSKTYVRGNQALLINRLRLAKAKARGLKSLKDIFSKNSGEVMISYEGSSYTKFGQTLFPQATIKTYKTADELFGALLEGDCTGIITDYLEAKSYLNENPDAKIKLLMISVKDHYDLISVGGCLKNHELIDFVNEYIEINNIEIDLKNITQKNTKGGA